MDSQDKKQNYLSRVLSVLIILLLALMAYQNLNFRSTATTDKPVLGPAGTEYYNQDMPSETQITKKGKIGASVPASVRVKDGKAVVQIKNTGGEEFVPYCMANGKEVYRASRVLVPGDNVIAVIPVETAADKIDTMVETLDGGKFSITSKIVR